MSNEYRRRILESIAECDRFIAREETRRAALRTADAQKALDFYKAHKVKLQGMLSL